MAARSPAYAWDLQSILISTSHWSGLCGQSLSCLDCSGRWLTLQPGSYCLKNLSCSQSLKPGRVASQTLRREKATPEEVADGFRVADGYFFLATNACACSSILCACAL